MVMFFFFLLGLEREREEVRQRETKLQIFFFCWVIVNAGARTPELKVTRLDRVPLGPGGKQSFKFESLDLERENK